MFYNTMCTMLLLQVIYIYAKEDVSSQTWGMNFWSDMSDVLLIFPAFQILRLWWNAQMILMTIASLTLPPPQLSAEVQNNPCHFSRLKWIRQGPEIYESYCWFAIEPMTSCRLGCEFDVGPQACQASSQTTALLEHPFLNPRSWYILTPVPV